MKTPEIGLALLCALNLPPAQAQDPGWKTALEKLRSKTEQQQVEAINRQVNQTLRFSHDQQLWQQNDYWATPGETLARGQGDCEDFAIAKYFLLRQLGIPSEKLWLMYATVQLGAPDSPHNIEHMVLGYTPEPGAEELILDNMLSSLHPLSRRPDLRPVFRFNTQEIRIGGKQYPASRLPAWHALLRRMGQPPARVKKKPPGS